MIGINIILTLLAICTTDSIKNQDTKVNEDFRQKDVKLITLLVVKKDKGNATRHVREINLDSKKIKDFIADINNTRKDGLVEIDETFTIIIKTKKNKEFRLVGQDRILLDRENSKHYNAGFNWTLKYWAKDLSQGGL